MQPTRETITMLARRNPEWRAAMMILASPIFLDPHGPDWRVWAHIYEYGIHFDDIMAEGTFSGGERHMIMIAGSLFNGSLTANLGHAFNTLGPDWAALAFQAIACVAGMSIRIEGMGGRGGE